MRRQCGGALRIEPHPGGALYGVVRCQCAAHELAVTADTAHRVPVLARFLCGEHCLIDCICATRREGLCQSRAAHLQQDTATGRVTSLWGPTESAAGPCQKVTIRTSYRPSSRPQCSNMYDPRRDGPAFVDERTRFAAVRVWQCLAKMREWTITTLVRADIFDAFPPGPQQDAWLAWLSQLATDSIWRDE